MLEDIVKLQKILSKKVKDKKYFKYQVTLPKQLVESLDWEPGAELAAKIEDDGILLKPEK